MPPDQDLKRKPRGAKLPRQFGEAAQVPLRDGIPGRAPWADTLIEALSREADEEGLLGGEKSQHVTFRAPPALVEAAKANLGIESTSELGMLALMLLAQPDPFVATMKKTRGALGEHHTLDY